MESDFEFKDFCIIQKYNNGDTKIDITYDIEKYIEEESGIRVWWTNEYLKRKGKGTNCKIQFLKSIWAEIYHEFETYNDEFCKKTQYVFLKNKNRFFSLNNPYRLFKNKDRIISIHYKTKNKVKALAAGNYDLYNNENLHISTPIKMFLEISENIYSYYIQKNLNQNYDKDFKKNHIISKNIYQSFKKLFLSEECCAIPYLTRTLFRQNKRTISDLIFPFGSNLSQVKAVENAFINQISIIEGPPGTGKTNTILNIISNLLIRNMKVLVVSNNNSAVENVIEKLSRIDKDFLVAKLGNFDNKKDFINSYKEDKITINKSSEKALLCPFISNEDFKDLKVKTLEIYQLNINIAKKKCEIRDVDLQLQHFLHECLDSTLVKIIKDIKILNIKKQDLNRIYKIQKNYIKYMKLNRNIILRIYFQFILVYYYHIPKSIINLENNDFRNVIRGLLLNSRELSLESELYDLIKRKEELGGDTICDVFTKESKKRFDIGLSNKFIGPSLEKVMVLMNLKEQSEINNNLEERKEGQIKILSDYLKEFLSRFPIVTSSTDSVRNIFNSQTLYSPIFDYVIMDEASQISIDKGILALSMAKNCVIVGDTKQLPNIIDNKNREIAGGIMSKYHNFRNNFNYLNQSLLDSILYYIDELKLENCKRPVQLLSEHYRCHPAIIDFCNKVFYNDELVIMTENNDSHPLHCITTQPNQKCAFRAEYNDNIQVNEGYYNCREKDIIIGLINGTEQDIYEDSLKGIKPQKLSIITPYKAQVEILTKFLEKLSFDTSVIEISTVHKFQGREKERIIISTVWDGLKEFLDDLSNYITFSEINDENKEINSEINKTINRKINNIKFTSNFINDPKLLNVAVSRAEKELWLITTGNTAAIEWVYDEETHKIQPKEITQIYKFSEKIEEKFNISELLQKFIYGSQYIELLKGYIEYINNQKSSISPLNSIFD
ncbi:MAG: AAA domain-containing protein, partial [Odoribacter sp.]|nr:AAA domain-containing protein [Odoribacter sp.]